MQILQPHPYKHSLRPGHLETVIAYMREHGTPTLRVVNIGGLYQALEGCHRLQAASILMADDSFEFDVTPEIEEMDMNDLVDWASFDFDPYDFDGVKTYGDLAECLYNANCSAYLRPLTF